MVGLWNLEFCITLLRPESNYATTRSHASKRQGFNNFPFLFQSIPHSYLFLTDFVQRALVLIKLRHSLRPISRVNEIVLFGVLDPYIFQKQKNQHLSMNFTCVNLIFDSSNDLQLEGQHESFFKVSVIVTLVRLSTMLDDSIFSSFGCDRMQHRDSICPTNQAPPILLTNEK